jgi:hypothetical protein
MRKNARFAACMLGYAAAFMLSAGAADSDWSFEVTPYFWGMGIDGRVGVGSLPPAEVKMDFGDIWDDFESALALLGVARSGPWMILGDFSYLDTQSKEHLPAASVTLDNDTTIAKLAAGYQVKSDLPMLADVYAGARYSRFKTGLDVSGVGSASVTEDWVDPLVGVNLVWPFASKWRAGLIADIGGFGVGSDLTWEILPSVQYQFSDMFSGKFGYRWLDVDYYESGYVSDTLSQGWMAGLGIAF